jgi:hypothetical protein
MYSIQRYTNKQWHSIYTNNSLDITLQVLGELLSNNPSQKIKIVKGN